MIPILEELKSKARAGVVESFSSPSTTNADSEYHGAGLTNLEYALCTEEMGRISWASEVFNCSAPDTGNMELLLRYGTPGQKAKWHQPLLQGEIRSAFLMTEPQVASSDATNIETSIVRDGNHYVINCRKWWSSGAGVTDDFGLANQYANIRTMRLVDGPDEVHNRAIARLEFAKCSAGSP